jgi:hypothetical protein
MKVTDIHAQSLAASAALSRYYMAYSILPADVIKVLTVAKVTFVLVGAHGISGWMDDPRATQDVVVVVAARHLKKAVNALLAAFPQLDPDDKPVVIRLRDRDTKKIVIDVMKPNEQLYRDVLNHTHTVTSGGQTFKIPSLEMALAMKFAAMISLHRQDEDKFQDAHDFIRMVKANAEIDLKKLVELGDVIFPGGGKEAAEKVEQVRRGETLNL